MRGKKVFYLKSRNAFALVAAAFALAFGFGACSNAGDTYVVNNIVQKNGGEKIYPVQIAELNLKMTPVRVFDEDAFKIVTDWEVPLGFRSGNDDIPYILFDSATVKKILGENYSISKVTAATKKVELTNTLTSAKAVIDLEKRNLAFDNYDAFFQKDLSKYWDPADLKATTDYMKIESVVNIEGSPVSVNWGALGIEMFIWKKDGGYFFALPFQAVNDIFLPLSFFNYIYNGTNLYKGVSDPILVTEYYKAPATGTRSQALADFCCAELCLNFQLNYGLKTIHGIDYFDNFASYFSSLGILDSLKSADQMTFAKTIKDVCEFYFGDGHSNYQKNSYLLGKDTEVAGTKISPFKKNYDANREKYIAARNKKIGVDIGFELPVMPCPCYTVTTDGKTAFVRFDSFTAKFHTRQKMIEELEKCLFTDYGLDTYVANKEDMIDTISMIHAVNGLIQADANIENVVLDLSCNGGGALHAAAYVLSWMLGEGTININNQLSGAKILATYKADVNFNGDYDAGDTISGKNLFCIISPLSFSCGNMVPAMLKASNRVTILGATSGGGTCCVQNSSAADGSYFTMSSKYAMSAIKNGSAYDIDRGVEPHYYINKPESFYDIEKIAALVKSINEAK